MRLSGAVAVLLSLPLWIDPPTLPVGRAAGASRALEDVVLIIRSDDGGMSHAPRESSAASEGRNVRLLTYRDVIAAHGLPFMHRPQVPVPQAK